MPPSVADNEYDVFEPAVDEICEYVKKIYFVLALTRCWRLMARVIYKFRISVKEEILEIKYLVCDGEDGGEKEVSQQHRMASEMCSKNFE